MVKLTEGNAQVDEDTKAGAVENSSFCFLLSHCGNWVQVHKFRSNEQLRKLVRKDGEILTISIEGT